MIRTRGIPLQVPRGDQLHRGDGVLERRPDHPRDVMVADQRRTRPVADGMQVQDRAAPVEFGEYRFEFADR